MQIDEFVDVGVILVDIVKDSPSKVVDNVLSLILKLLNTHFLPILVRMVVSLICLVMQLPRQFFMLITYHFILVRLPQRPSLRISSNYFIGPELVGCNLFYLY